MSLYCKVVFLMGLTHMQVALLDFNDTAGKSLIQSLQSQYGQGRSLFLNCNVESEEAFRGSWQTAAPKYSSNIHNGQKMCEIFPHPGAVVFFTLQIAKVINRNRKVVTIQFNK